MDAKLKKLLSLSPTDLLKKLTTEEVPVDENTINGTVNLLFKEMAEKLIKDFPRDLSDSPNFFSGVIVGLHLMCGLVYSREIRDISDLAKILATAAGEEPIKDPVGLAILHVFTQVYRTRENLVKAAAQMGVKLED